MCISEAEPRPRTDKSRHSYLEDSDVSILEIPTSPVHPVHPSGIRSLISRMNDIALMDLHSILFNTAVSIHWHHQKLPFHRLGRQVQEFNHPHTADILTNEDSQALRMIC